MSESITVKFSLHAAAKDIYDAWLDSEKHSAMTGEKATASRELGGAFNAWNGYISGKNLLLIPNKKIVQSWRSSEFPEDAADSVLSIQLIEAQGITEVDLEHKDIPPGQGLQYRAGWIDYYANPMQRYFAERLKSTPGVSSRTKARKTSKARDPGKKVRAKSNPKKTAKKTASKKAAAGRSAGVKKKIAATKKSSRKSGQRR